MIQKNIPLRVLSGLILWISLACAVMVLFPHTLAGSPGTGIAFPLFVQQTVPAGSGDLPQFSSTDEVRAFLLSHTEGNDTPLLLTDGTSPTGSVESGMRTWQFDIDTSTFRPDEYIVTAGAVVQDASGTALFNLLDPTQPRAPQQVQQSADFTVNEDPFININQIGDYYVGDKITITGQTNLAADDEILVQVYPSTFKPTQKSQSGEFSGAAGTIRASSASVSVPASSSTRAPPAEPGRDYSTTNVQVKDVDEADIVKTDGTYVYVVSGSFLHILKGYPATDAGIIATLQFSGSPQSLYLNGDRLVLISSTQRQNDFQQCQPGACSYRIPSTQKTQVFIYSVRDAAHPVLERELELDGMYKDSRMIGTLLYFVTNNYLDRYGNDGHLPRIDDSGRGSLVPPVYYFDRTDRQFSLTTIGAVDIRAPDAVNAKTFLIGSAGTVYVSTKNLYIAVPAAGNKGMNPSTDLYSFALDEGRLAYSARGTVDGTLLSPYSLDEYNGNLRVATTVMTGSWRMNSGSYSRVTVLDKNLALRGTLSDLAPGEKIYAARFMGERLYLVTFRETDPLFVIDLADPGNPGVLGELHIPGFSQYLHPCDATHLIGVGKESTWGGLKIALFDVADVRNPRLVGEKKLGAPGSDSEVLRDPKAFLFDREKDILVLPVHIVENTPSGRGTRAVWGGAYVFGVDPDKGFTEKGTVVHYRDSDNLRHVKRAFYIEDVLYTVASDKIVLSDLKNSTSRIGSVGLP